MTVAYSFAFRCIQLQMKLLIKSLGLLLQCIYKTSGLLVVLEDRGCWDSLCVSDAIRGTCRDSGGVVTDFSMVRITGSGSPCCSTGIDLHLPVHWSVTLLVPYLRYTVHSALVRLPGYHEDTDRIFCPTLQELLYDYRFLHLSSQYITAPSFVDFLYFRD